MTLLKKRSKRKKGVICLVRSAHHLEGIEPGAGIRISRYAARLLNVRELDNELCQLKCS